MPSTARPRSAPWVLVFALLAALSLAFNVKLPPAPVGGTPVSASPSSVRPSPTPASPTPTPTPTPSPSASRDRNLLLPLAEPAGGKGAWWDQTADATHAQRDFTGVRVSGARCPELRFTNQTTLQASALNLVTCLQQRLDGPLSKANYAVSVPRLIVCGQITAKNGCDDRQAAASMSYDNTMRLYWRSFGQMNARESTLVVLHEYFHALQFWFGVDEDKRLHEPDRDRFSRRLELQALCGSVVLAAAFTSRPYDDRDVEFSVDSGGDTHWNEKAARYWIKQGLAADDFGGCNTMEAADRLVG